MKAYLTSLGCKLNQSEVEAWARRLASAGWEVVRHATDAELCVVNTCTVTHVAARKSRNLVRRCAKTNPNAQVVVTGCHAEIDADELARLPGVSLVLGSAAKDHLVDELAARLALPVLAGQGHAPQAPSLRTRALVKIQDGCDNGCTYCVVRLARGAQRSRPMADILQEIRERQDEGFQEIVLTGVHIGAYGRERSETLAGLLDVLLAQTRVPRIRLSSIEPWDISRDLLRLWANPRVCRHMHLPLQSGCDGTLKRMGRRYTTAQYRDLVANARAAVADLAVTTDVIVGFPGEDEREFHVSAAFVASQGFARVHVFPFSPRPGTDASCMPDQVSPQVQARRAARVRRIAQVSAHEFLSRFLGTTLDVLWEAQDGTEWSGLTDNYIRVHASSGRSLRNQIIPARLLEVSASAVRGELVPTVGCKIGRGI